VATYELSLTYVPMLRAALVHMLPFYIPPLVGTVWQLIVWLMTGDENTKVGYMKLYERRQSFLELFLELFFVRILDEPVQQKMARQGHPPSLTLIIG